MVKFSDERDDEAVWCLHSVKCASRGSRLLQPLVVGEEWVGSQGNVLSHSQYGISSFVLVKMGEFIWREIAKRGSSDGLGSSSDGESNWREPSVVLTVFGAWKRAPVANHEIAELVAVGGWESEKLRLLWFVTTGWGDGLVVKA